MESNSELHDAPTPMDVDFDDSMNTNIENDFLPANSTTLGTSENLIKSNNPESTTLKLDSTMKTEIENDLPANSITLGTSENLIGSNNQESTILKLEFSVTPNIENALPDNSTTSGTSENVIESNNRENTILILDSSKKTEIENDLLDNCTSLIETSKNLIDFNELNNKPLKLDSVINTNAKNNLPDNTTLATSEDSNKEDDNLLMLNSPRVINFIEEAYNQINEVKTAPVQNKNDSIEPNTELLVLDSSSAYSLSNQTFQCVPTVILEASSTTDVLDFTYESEHPTVIDLFSQTKLMSTSQNISNEEEELVTMLEEAKNLKLELSKIRQEKLELESENHKRDEIILKTQANFLETESALKQEIKELQEKLNSINNPKNNDGIEEENDDLKNSKSKLIEKIKLQDKEIADLSKTIKDYLQAFVRISCEAAEYRPEFNYTKKHLAAIEEAFNDVHSKYERSKRIVLQYKDNEEVLLVNLKQGNAYAQSFEEHYNSLKAQAISLFDKANKEFFDIKESHLVEVKRLNSLRKRLEIKNSATQQSLNQKSKECSDLAALCDELMKTSFRKRSKPQ